MQNAESRIEKPAHPMLYGEGAAGVFLNSAF